MWYYREVQAFLPPSAMAGQLRDSMRDSREVPRTFNADGFWLMEAVAPVITEGWDLVMTLQTGNVVRFLFRKQG